MKTVGMATLGAVVSGMVVAGPVVSTASATLFDGFASVSDSKPSVTFGQADGEPGDVAVGYGQVPVVSVTVSGAPANSSVFVSVDGVPLAPIAVDGTVMQVTLPHGSYALGEHTITMTLADTVDAAAVYATGSGRLIVEQAATEITVALNADQRSVAGKVTTQFGTMPTGTVTLTSRDKTVGTATIASDGRYKAALVGWTAPSGDVVARLVASYAGDENHISSTIAQMVSGDGRGFTRCGVTRPVPVFADTALSHKFYKEIDWMECQNYSTGWRQPGGKPIYKPDDNLQRQAMAAFIFRMEAPKDYRAPKVSPFADVQPGDSFYKEISWLYESKLSTGYKEAAGKPTFRPQSSLTREAMAAFIYRLEAPRDKAAKNYTAPAVSPMADMRPGMPFYKEISWMYDVRLSTGNKTASGKEYRPTSDLSRQAMAAFIYRLVREYRA